MSTSLQTRGVVVNGIYSPVLIGGTGRAGDMDALVVFGAADVYIPVAQAEEQRRVVPRVQIEILPGVGHWAWLEQPGRVAEHVVPFLRERVGQTAQNEHTTRSFT